MAWHYLQHLILFLQASQLILAGEKRAVTLKLRHRMSGNALIHLLHQRLLPLPLLLFRFLFLFLFFLVLTLTRSVTLTFILTLTLTLALTFTLNPIVNSHL